MMLFLSDDPLLGLARIRVSNRKVKITTRNASHGSLAGETILVVSRPGAVLPSPFPVAKSGSWCVTILAAAGNPGILTAAGTILSKIKAILHR
jgi:hypothetical protein